MESAGGRVARRTGGARGRGQEGYILAMLLGVCTVMGILLTKALPAVNAEVQREAEAELIYRGEHIARGIKAYQAKTGGYPIELQQLLKLKPRLLRQVYKDPMTPSGEWELVYAVSPGASGDTTNLPIVGVRSRSLKDTFKIYKNKTVARDWVFSATEAILGLPGSGRDGAPGGEGREPKPGGGEAPPPPKS